MGEITLNEEQQRKAEVLARVTAGSIQPPEAATLLQVTVRQVYNLMKQYEEKGIACVVHGNAGRVPVHRTPQEVELTIAQLAGPGGKYHDFNTSHMQELLRDLDGVRIGRSTLDRLLKKLEVRSPSSPKRRTKRRRRERSSAEGMMVQIDASPHDWLEGRGPRMVLVGAIDDATGKVLFLAFRPTEDQVGYLLLFRHVALTFGLPITYYHDRHTMLRSPKKPDLDDELAGRKFQSELQRIMDELGVASIAALSPEAKGRVERLWRTLQDRLLREMRLAGVSTLEEANAFLPKFIARYSARFAVPPADPNPAWVPVRPDMDLSYYFSVRETRTVANDHAISWYRKPILILRRAGETSLAKQKVTVHIDPEGALYVYHGKQRLRHQVLEKRPDRPAAVPAPDVPSERAKQDPKAAARKAGWLYGGSVGPQPSPAGDRGRHV